MNGLSWKNMNDCSLFIYFFYTTDLQKHNTKTKSLLNQRTTALLDIWQSDGVNQIKIKKTHIYV